MRHLLVTGGCGFIGCNFIRYLIQQQDFHGRIINVDKITYAGNRDNLKDIEAQYPHRYHFVQGDICDQYLLEKIFHDYAIDSVCHFAAESHVDRSITSPEGFIQTNIIGTLRLLEAVKKFHKQFLLFHHVSTDEVYGSLGDEGQFTENAPYDPKNPYSASKAASDHLVRAYFNTYKIPVTLSNCSNNYGPYQLPEKLIPLTILNILNSRPIPVYGHGENTRDWLYVRDHCTAIWAIMKHGQRGSTYNIGGHNEIKNLHLVETICDLMSSHQQKNDPFSNRSLITFVKDRPGHDWRYAIDSSKITRELQWKPQESFQTGIRHTINWYLQNSNWIAQTKVPDNQEKILSNQPVNCRIKTL